MCQTRVKKFFLLIFGCIFALVCLASAAVLIGKYHRLTHIMLDSSGGKIDSSSYQSRSSIGQKFVGEAKSAFYRNLSGYIRLSEEQAPGSGIRIVRTTPEDKGYFVIGRDVDIEIKFNKYMSSATVIPPNISITDEDNTGLTLNKDDIVCVSSVTTVTPPLLKHCTRYTVEVSTNVEDVYGNSLPKSESFSFTTLIREKETGEVIVKHKAGIVKIGSPADTFPGESKGWYINLIETDIGSLSKYVEGTARELICYKVNGSDNTKDIDWLERPVTISIPYPRDTKDKRNLRLYFYNKEINRWELVKGSGYRNPDDGDYYIIGEVKITNTEYCVRVFAMGGLIEEYSNYPNPFKAGKKYTTIRYVLEKDAKVTISIYDLLGQLVRRIKIPKGTLPGGKQGPNEVPWYGKNERGRVVANGGYYCVLEADTENGKHMKKVRKIMVIK